MLIDNGTYRTHAMLTEATFPLTVMDSPTAPTCILKLRLNRS